MWAITNETPFAAERAWVRDKNGAEVWLVAVKGTFDIKPDESLQLAEEQEEVNIAPMFRGDPEITSLLCDTDLPHKKQNTDILVEGHAYAPNGKPVKKIDVSLKVANIKKKLRVTGDRVWQRSLLGVTLTRPQPFVTMPITYERAFGGTDETAKKEKHHRWDLRNPVGCGFATKANHLIGKPAPNIEDPSSLVSNRKHKSRPAGFGPIAGHWSPRRELTGTYDEKWENNRLPLLPDDFNESYYQCAPEDQKASGYIRAGESFELYNMTPAGVLKFRLPRVSIGFTTHFDDGSSEEHRPVLHTVIVKPDFPRVVMVWHTSLECHHKVLKLRNTTVRVKKRILQSEEDKKINAWETSIK